MVEGWDRRLGWSWDRRLGWGWDGRLRGQDGRLMEATEKEGLESWNRRLGKVLVVYSLSRSGRGSD